MSYVGSEYGLINHNKITKIFVGADVLEIFTQAAGAAMLVRNTSILYLSNSARTLRIPFRQVLKETSTR